MIIRLYFEYINQGIYNYLLRFISKKIYTYFFQLLVGLNILVIVCLIINYIYKFSIFLYSILFFIYYISA